ncbi:hypothetical protein NP233_g12042 [Leucocoprinus birnbaumii]|uniref:Uncharacterized protein n=1 Tax=Leucocoprinus birnbaumii TaxID=56174 RepID=A0AAD5YKS8_9AGAR|nr:hypothetical protein NP233_g12042 [Leucocoprinus birnbaumii]
MSLSSDSGTALSSRCVETASKATLRFIFAVFILDVRDLFATVQSTEPTSNSSIKEYQQPHYRMNPTTYAEPSTPRPLLKSSVKHASSAKLQEASSTMQLEVQRKQVARSGERAEKLQHCFSDLHPFCDSHATTSTSTSHVQSENTLENTIIPESFIPDITASQPRCIPNGEAPAEDSFNVIEPQLTANPYVVLSNAQDSFFVIVTFGIVYWLYVTYRYKSSITRSSADSWSENVKHMSWCWKTYMYISAGTLPLLFPMLAAAGLPTCSVTRILVTSALLSGIITLVLSALYRACSETLCEDCTMMLWLQASDQTWSSSKNKKFWFFLCLPTVWFLVYFTLLVTSVASPFWESISALHWGQPSADGQTELCVPAKLVVFGSLILLTIFVASAHLIFATIMFRKPNRGRNVHGTPDSQTQ